MSRTLRRTLVLGGLLTALPALPLCAATAVAPPNMPAFAVDLPLSAADSLKKLHLPAGYVAGMEQSFDYYARLSTPQRTTPAFNDASVC